MLSSTPFKVHDENAVPSVLFSKQKTKAVLLQKGFGLSDENSSSLNSTRKAEKTPGFGISTIKRKALVDVSSSQLNILNTNTNTLQIQKNKDHGLKKHHIKIQDSVSGIVNVHNSIHSQQDDSNIVSFNFLKYNRYISYLILG